MKSCHPVRDRVLFTLIVGLILIGTQAAAQVSSLTSVFQQVRSTTVWLVDATTLDDLTSTFGPRIRVSTGAYDWHRGIDIDAPIGTPVRAVADATFFGIRNYVDGGLTVILRHAFPAPVTYMGRNLTSYYTYHMHLSSVEPSLEAAAAAGATPVVSRGTQIGTVGDSGSAVDSHLHLELRVGSPYSLEWQLQNPTSIYGANAYGFDPHVHPLWLFVPYASSELSLAAIKKPVKSDGTVRVTTNDDQPLLNRILVQIQRKSDGRVMASHVLDFNERTGFDATSTTALDTVDASRPYLSPIPFGFVSPYATDIILPKSFVGAYFGSKYLTTVVVHDIWGVSRTIAW